MSRGYESFAGVYDLLTFNVPYDEIADYYDKVISGLVSGRRTLDMGCGTGSLTVRMAAKGYDIIGQDASEEALSIAALKSSKVQWICQKMEETELGESVDVVISTLDSINHLENAETISRCFHKAADHLKQGGAFVFDVNTVYKHREILGNETYVYDVDGVYCAWLNTFDPEDCGVDIELDLFFENEDGRYTRSGDSFREIALEESEYRRLLREAGFRVEKVYDYLSFDAPDEKSEKLLIAAVKE